MDHHVGVIHLGHALMAREQGFVAFSHGREAPVRALAPGDRVAIYAPRTGVEGDPVQAFVALATVTGEAPYRRPFMGDGHEPWCRDAAFDEGLRQAPVRPLLPHLSFVRDPKHWGMAFRQGKFRIPEADFRIIEEAMTA